MDFAFSDQTIIVCTYTGAFIYRIVFGNTQFLEIVTILARYSKIVDHKVTIL